MQKQKLKKLLCVLMSWIMLFSVFSTGFTAAAQGISDKAESENNYGNFLKKFAEKSSALLSELFENTASYFDSSSNDSAVAEVESSIMSYEGDVSKADASEEDVAAYTALTEQFKALSPEQKDSIDMYALSKIVQLVYDREIALQTSGTSTQKKKNAHLKLYEVLGEVPCLRAAEECAAVLGNTKATGEEMLEAYSNAGSVTARVFAGLWYKSYSAFYYKIEEHEGNALKTIANTLFSAAKKAYPFEEVAPAKVTKPTASKYDQGENDPAYISDLEAYNRYQYENYLYSNRKSIYESELLYPILAQIAEYAPEMSEASSWLSTAFDAGKAFNEDITNTAPAKSAYEKYEQISDFSKAVIGSVSITGFGYIAKTSAQPFITNKTVYLSALPDFIKNICEIENIDGFVELVAQQEEPYDTANYEPLLESYDALSDSLMYLVPQETVDKYNNVMTILTGKIQKLEREDISIDGWEKTVVEYPENATKDRVEASLPELDKVVNDIASKATGQNLSGLIYSNLYTNAMVSTIAKAIFPLLGDLTSLVAKAPSDLGKVLTEEEYAGAVAALNAATEANTSSDKLAAWDYVEFKNGDWFIDGDKEGFIAAVSALFRPLNLMSMVLTFEDTYNTKDGTVTYGAYSDVVPLLEALGIECLSSTEYTLKVEADIAERGTANCNIELSVKPLLEMVFNYLDKVAVAPVTELSILLPKLAYALNTGLINTQLAALVSNIKMVSIDVSSLDVSTKNLFNMIAGIDDVKDDNGVVTDYGSITIDLGELNSAGQPVREDNATLSIAINGMTINLKEADFIQLMEDSDGCGEAVITDETVTKYTQAVEIQSDKTEAFVTLFNYIYTDVLVPNSKVLTPVLESVGVPTFIQPVVQTLVDMALNNISQETALTTVINVVNPQAPALPDSNPIIDFIKNGSIGEIFNKVISFISGIFGGNSDNSNNSNNNTTDNNGGDDSGNLWTDNIIDSIPNTSAFLSSAVLPMLIAAGAAGVAVVIKRKDDGN